MARDSLIGTTLADRFEIEEAIGSGGMAEVYRAKHTVLGRYYAIKVIREDIASDPVVAQRFRREAKAASLFDHPNIVAISDFGCTEDDRPFLVMEYVEGKELREVLEEVAPDVLPAKRGLDILAQLAGALQAAHAAGVVHRDLKPENLILSPTASGGDQLKILDFGLAKIVEGADVNNLTALTRAGEIFGTPAYMAPEQSMAKVVDYRADIYAYGVIMYEMCTGHLPFAYDSIPRTLIAHQNEDPPHPTRPGGAPLSPDIEEMIFRCLIKQPEGRLADLGLVVDVLERNLQPHRETQRVFSSPLDPMTEPAQRAYIAAESGGWSVSPPITETTEPPASSSSSQPSGSTEAPQVRPPSISSSEQTAVGKEGEGEGEAEAEEEVGAMETVALGSLPPGLVIPRPPGTDSPPEVDDNGVAPTIAAGSMAEVIGEDGVAPTIAAGSMAEVIGEDGVAPTIAAGSMAEVIGEDGVAPTIAAGSIAEVAGATGAAGTKAAAPSPQLVEPSGDVEAFLTRYGQAPPNPDDHELGWQKATLLGSTLTRWLMSQKLAARPLIRQAARLYQTEEQSQHAFDEVASLDSEWQQFEDGFRQQESAQRIKIIDLSNARSELAEQRGDIARLAELGKQLQQLEQQLADLYERFEPARREHESRLAEARTAIERVRTLRRDLENELLNAIFADLPEAIPDDVAQALQRLRALMIWLRR